VVLARDEERVPGEEWTGIEERHADIVLEDEVRRLVAGDDPAEEAVARQRR
jgi:hypothetical protein